MRTSQTCSVFCAGSLWAWCCGPEYTWIKSSRTLTRPYLCGLRNPCTFHYTSVSSATKAWFPIVSLPRPAFFPSLFSPFGNSTVKFSFPHLYGEFSWLWKAWLPWQQASSAQSQNEGIVGWGEREEMKSH